jgi:hypothetical protein
MAHAYGGAQDFLSHEYIARKSSVGLQGIEPCLYAPHAHVLPVYYSPIKRCYSSAKRPFWLQNLDLCAYQKSFVPSYGYWRVNYDIELAIFLRDE